jgi:dephospho-CoA kinase
VIRVGLTGSMATGKTTVLQEFAALGAATVSADDIVHQLYRGAAVAPLQEAFPGVVAGVAVDRAALSRVLAEDPGRLPALEAIVHPLVREEIARFLADAETRGHALAVVEVPLLFETGHDYGFDVTVATVCDPEIQRRRILARPGMTVEKLEALLARQLPQAEKRKRADHVVDTSTDPAATREQVRALVAALQAGASQQQ